MKIAISLGMAAIAGFVVAPALATETTPIHHHRHHAHHVTQVAPAPIVEQPVVEQPAQAAQGGPFGAMFRPYAHPGEGDDDGLSSDPDDCMKGCIGGEPR